MAMKERFLKEVHIGDRVDIMAGPKEIEGQVVSLDLETVQIKKADGRTAALSLDMLAFFEVLANEPATVKAEVSEEKAEDEPQAEETREPEASAEVTEAQREEIPDTGEETSPAVEEPSESVQEGAENPAPENTSEQETPVRVYQPAPTYIEAQKARSARRFKEAEELYIRAIALGERQGTATANLVSLMIQQHMYPKALEYLTVYGERFMRPESCANMKKQVEDLAAAAAVKPRIPVAQATEETPFWDRYYQAAHHAEVDEKNLEKAVENYRLAIRYKQRLRTSIPNLAMLYSRLGRYDDALKLLDKEGRTQLEPQKYLNLRMNVMKKARDPRYEAELTSIYERLAALNAAVNPQADATPDYFFIAQKAELEEKDLPKAISYYKQAISHKQRMTGSVPNLVSIYSRLEMYDEALKLLDSEGRACMEQSKYLNQRMTVLKKAKDPGFKQDIMETYEKLIALSRSLEKQTDLLMSEAYNLASIGEYEVALQIFGKCEAQMKPFVYAQPAKYERQHMNLMRGFAYAYYKSGNQEEARRYAETILKTSPDNEFAQSVMNGRLAGDTELADESVGVMKIGGYFRRRMEELSLENELKDKKLVKDGIFTDTQETASHIIDNITSRLSANDEIRSSSYYAIAKLVRQILDRDEEITMPKAFSEQQYQLYVSIASFFAGNYRVSHIELTDRSDTARYFFESSAASFRDAKKPHKCWAAATVRYMQSLYFTQEELRQKGTNLYARINQPLKDCRTELHRTMNGQLQVRAAQFVAAMMHFFVSNSRVRGEVFRNLFSSGQYNEVLPVLEELAGRRAGAELTIAQFEELWDDAAKVYEEKHQNFLRRLDETIGAMSSIGQLQDAFHRLKELCFERWMNATDSAHVTALYRMFTALMRYNEIPEFDYKADTLSRADEMRRQLEQEIQTYPTALSYEELLPRLTQLEAKLFRESAALYENAEPKLTVSLSGDCSADEESGVVRVPMAFTNLQNVQSADNVAISIAGENIENLHDSQLSRELLPGNGKSLEKIIELRVPHEILREQAFSVDVTISYQYRKNMTETVERTEIIPLSIPLYSEATFQPIENRFEPYRNGSQVEDASMFYGRDRDIEEIVSQISDEQGNLLRGRCLALYGQTRTGKSSLLYHLELKLRERDAEGNVIVNVGSIGEENLEGSDISELLYTILDVMDYEIKHDHPVLAERLAAAGVVIDADRVLEESEHAQLYFNDVFKKIGRVTDEEPGRWNIIIMIDEFTYIYDWIRRGVMTDRIMKFWKAFIQNSGVFAIVIGQDHMMKFVSEQQFTNDFGSTDLRKVTYLPREDAKRLMYEPILLEDPVTGGKVSRYKEEALDRIYELTAGSAFLIMNLCAGLVDYLNETHSVFITRAHVDDYLRKNLASFEERFFEPQYDDKSEIDSGERIEQNKRILRRIAQLSNRREWTPLAAVARTEEDRELLRALEQRDVVLIERGERCKLKVALYKEWLIEKYGLEAVNE